MVGRMFSNLCQKICLKIPPCLRKKPGKFQIEMAGGEGDIPKLTGIHKIFNSYTKDGRFNIAITAYATAFLLYLGLKFRPKGEAPKK